MLAQMFVRNRIPLLATGVLGCAVLLVGCDENVHITRDRDAHIARHATWAWRPAQEVASGRGARPVVPRDVITRNGAETITPEDTAENDILRGKVKNAIEHDLNQKGLKEVNDPQSADL